MRKHVANLVAHVLTISFFFVYVLIIDKWLNTTKHVSISKVSISKDASKEKGEYIKGCFQFSKAGTLKLQIFYVQKMVQDSHTHGGAFNLGKNY